MTIRDIPYCRVNRHTGRESARVTSARPSRLALFDAVQRPACINLEVRDGAIRKLNAAHDAMHVSRTDVSREELPTPKRANFLYGAHYYLAPSLVQQIRGVAHPFPRVRLQRKRGLTIAAAMIAAGPIHPAPFIAWKVGAVAVEG